MHTQHRVDGGWSGRGIAGAVCLVSVVLWSVFGGSGVRAQGQQDTSGVVYDSTFFQSLNYRMVGPARGGRVTAVAGHRGHPGTFYMGATGGGVWKTVDYGTTWKNVSDGFFKTQSIGAIQVADSDSSVVYVGTGSDGIRSNVIIGRGMYKSVDAGSTWTFIGLPKAGQIGAVEVHPEDPNRVYVAALGNPFGNNPERGVYRSTDGGETWENVLYASDSTGAVDLELNPANPDEVYATLWRAERKPWTIISGAREENGLYRSTDGGDTWTKLENGLPQGLIGKIDLAVTPADPNRIYALVEAPDEEEGLYRSDDRGDSWRLMNDSTALMTRPFYFTNVDADPKNPDVVYIGNVRFFRSTDGGQTVEERPTPHVDNHDMWINPDDPDLIVQGNDGGANVTLDGGETWSTQHNQPTAELYQVDVDDRFPYWLYAGQQDNTTIAVPSRPPSESAPAGPESYWKAIGGCETGPAVPKPGDPTIVYSNCKGRFGRYSHVTGQERQYYVGAEYMYGRNPAELKYRFQRVAPIEVSPHDSNTVYHASQFVHRTRDGGQTWETISPDLTASRPERQVVSGGPITRDITGEEHYSTLYEVEESPLERGVIWVGANDGPVHVSRDDGATWTEVTPKDMPPEGRIDGIEPSPHTPGKAYVAGYRYLLDDWRPYLYRTTDYGQTWTQITEGIPEDHPVRAVAEDPEREGLLYAGTEYGVFVSFDDGARWQPLQQNLPVVPVTGLRVQDGDLALSTMGRSFWMLEDLTPLRQLDAAVASSDVHLFQPRDAHRMRYEVPKPGPGVPAYPPPGATIDYYLAEAPAGHVTLEILDAGGNIVRRFSSAAAETPDPERPADMRMNTPARTARTDVGLPKKAGLNRFRWDLHHPGPWTADSTDRREGPLVVPGAYEVRLAVGDSVHTQPLQVRIDPRVEADGVTVADLEAQTRLNLQIRDALTDARQAAARIDSLQKDLDGAEGAAASRDALQQIEDALVTSEKGSYPPPMLIDQFVYLYGMTTRADQRPGQDAFDRYAELRDELDEHLQELDRVQQRAGALGEAGNE